MARESAPKTAGNQTRTRLNAPTREHIALRVGAFNLSSLQDCYWFIKRALKSSLPSLVNLSEQMVLDQLSPIHLPSEDIIGEAMTPDNISTAVTVEVAHALNRPTAINGRQSDILSLIHI